MDTNLAIHAYGSPTATREKPSGSASILPSSSAGCRATDKALQLTCSSSACYPTLLLYMSSSSEL